QRGLLAYAPRNVRLAQWQKHRPQLTAQAWEELCRTAVPSGVMASAAGEAGGPWGVASRYWRGNQPEWNVVAQSLDGAAILLGECKWWSRKPQSTDLAQLADELVRRPIPHCAAGADRIVRVAFVPELPTRTYREPGVVFVTAEQVLCSLATS
ncbi:MAG: hypothetical protein GF331_15270, partial [Chitinivibrionales bacterium]|nr:hypothetical protein [Chitinivibrionales bacterium]